MRTNTRPLSTGRFHLPAALFAVLLLTGCAGGSHVGESWQCPIAQGTACRSVSEADPAVRAPGEAQETELPAPVYDAASAEASVLNDFIAWFTELFRHEEEQDEGVATAEPLVVEAQAPPDAAKEPLRTKERIARIWIAPYVDAGSVYREGQWVRAVIRPAGWRLP